MAGLVDCAGCLGKAELHVSRFCALCRLRIRLARERKAMSPAERKAYDAQRIRPEDRDRHEYDA